MEIYDEKLKEADENISNILAKQKQPEIAKIILGNI